MIQIDIPLAAAAGSLLADAANRQLKAGRAEYYFRALTKNLLFQIFGLGWVPVYFLTNFFGWETSHLWWKEDSVIDYPWFLTITVLLIFAVGTIGFLSGNFLIVRGHMWANRFVYIGIGVYTLVWVFGQTNRTFRLGTYREWQEGTAPYFWNDRTFLWMTAVSAVSFGGGLLLTALSLWREGTHLDRRLVSGSNA